MISLNILQCPFADCVKITAPYDHYWQSYQSQTLYFYFLLQLKTRQDPMSGNGILILPVKTRYDPLSGYEFKK